MIQNCFYPSPVKPTVDTKPPAAHAHHILQMRKLQVCFAVCRCTSLVFICVLKSHLTKRFLHSPPPPYASHPVSSSLPPVSTAGPSLPFPTIPEEKGVQPRVPDHSAAMMPPRSGGWGVGCFLTRVNRRESTKSNMKTSNCVRKSPTPIAALPRWIAGTNIFPRGSVCLFVCFFPFVSFWESQ